MIRIGETYVHGRDRDTAQLLMQAARNVGIDPRSVRATDSGFIVASEVWDEAERLQRPTWTGHEAVI